MRSFRDQKILITGATRGLGKLIAEALAAEGASVILWGRDTAALDAYVQGFAELGASYHLPVGTYSTGMKARLAFALSMGVDFDVYLVDEVIGVGGMGIVFRAEHLMLRKQVAIKLMLPPIAKDAGLGTRMEREARAASATGHRNVVAVTDMGRDENDRLYIVMEYLKGVTLSSILHNAGPLALPRAAEIIAQVLTGLAAVHAEKVGAEVVIMTVPFASHDQIIDSVRDSVQGKIFVDTTAPLVPPKVMRVQLPPGGSVAKAAQERLGEDVRVVSAFQNIAAAHLRGDVPLQQPGARGRGLRSGWHRRRATSLPGLCSRA